MIADTRKTEGNRLKITEKSMQLWIDGKLITTTNINKENYFIEYISINHRVIEDYDETNNLARELGVTDVCVTTLLFRKSMRRSEIYMSGIICFINHDGINLHMRVSEAKKAFMKLKELGFGVREWQA
jgi:hypothetical protein